MATIAAAAPEAKKKPVPKRVTERRQRALAEKLSAEDAKFLDDLLLPRSRSVGEFLGRQLLRVRRRMSRTEFETVCGGIRNYLEGKAMDPAEVRDRARKLFEAYTDVACRTSCPVCEDTWIAILIIQVRGWTGTMFYSRSFQLVDPNQRGGK